VSSLSCDALAPVTVRHGGLKAARLVVSLPESLFCTSAQRSNFFETNNFSAFFLGGRLPAVPGQMSVMLEGCQDGNSLVNGAIVSIIC
jgi:hypothetical protein